jgi:phosphinothricin acetyltransferase
LQNQLTPLHYTDASSDDLPFIVAVYNSTIESRQVTADLAPITVDSRTAWLAEHNATNRPLWIVKSDTEAVGWVSLQDFYSRPAYEGTVEVSIYLHPHHQGKGYGKEILLHTLQACGSMGIHSITAFIFAANEKSIQLFTLCGFSQWGLLPGIAMMDDNPMDLIILGIKI